MLNEPWFYWLLFVFAAVLVIGMPLVERWEHRQDERDRRAWDRTHP